MLKRIIAVVLLIAACALGYRAWNQSRQRVTLDVRDAPLAEVARSIARQTGAAIEVKGTVTNLVTLEIRNVPLRDALELAAEQADCRVETSGETYILKALFDWSRRLPHHLAGPPPGGDVFEQKLDKDNLPKPGPERVMIPLGSGGAPPPEALRRPPPPPPRELPPIADLMNEGIRNSTPEQRATRLRETRNVPLPKPPQ